MKRWLIPLLTTTVLMVALDGGAQAFHGETVFIANRCGGHAYKPWGVVVACGDGNLYVTGLRYQTYGQQVARATATIHANDCLPYCAAGHFHTYRGSVSFRDVVRCEDGRLYYSRIRLTVSRGPTTWPIAPLEECSSVLV